MHKNDRLFAKMLPEVLLADQGSSPLRTGGGLTTKRDLRDIGASMYWSWPLRTWSG